MFLVALALLVPQAHAEKTVCASGCDYTTIAEAIPDSDDTLRLMAEDYEVGVIDMQDSVEIIGAGKGQTRLVCDAQGKLQIYTGCCVINRSITLRDLTLESCQNETIKGYSQSWILLDNVEVISVNPGLTLKASTGSIRILDSEMLPAFGESVHSGGWATTSAHMTIERSTLIGGHGSYFGAVSGSRTLTVKDSVFIGNRATSGDGGAIRHVENGVYADGFKIERNVFCGNSASGNGGAVYVQMDSGTESWDRNLFLGNSAGANGGAIYVYPSFSRDVTLNLRNNDFLANDATSGSAFYARNGGTLALRSINNLYAYNASGSSVLHSLDTVSTSGTSNNVHFDNGSMIGGGMGSIDSDEGDPLLVTQPPYDVSGPDFTDCGADFSFLAGSPLDNAGIFWGGTPDNPPDIGFITDVDIDDVDGDGFLGAVDDCDDSDPALNPLALEVCDGVDNDCDGRIDVDANTGVAYYADDDGDGWGGDSLGVLCDQPDGSVERDGDCDDVLSDVNPDAAEVCGGGDEDCNGVSDDEDPGVTGAPGWFADADGDGFGIGTAIEQCEAPDGSATGSGDCDDGNGAVHPNADEVCFDGLDNDCSGDADGPDAVDALLWYADADSDGFGDAGTVSPSCEQPTGTVADDTDCDDTRAAAFPSAPETCNDLDDDCDELADESGAVDAPLWYADADSDGFGDPDAETTGECLAPAGTVADDTDCDDTDPASYPGATEVLGDGVDQDCDGDDPLDPDLDDDGYDDVAHGGTDCDDLDPDVNPDADEVAYDGIDNDCVDGDETDIDDDGHDSPFAGGDDCDDFAADVNPDQDEIWYDGVDQNCDGNDDDADGDGQASYEVSGGTDCDDTDPERYLGAPEPAGTAVDYNCSGTLGTASYSGGCECDGSGGGPASGGLVALMLVATRRRRR